MVNFVYINLSLNDCVVPVTISNIPSIIDIKTNFEFENPDELQVFSNFSFFIKILKPHINLKPNLLGNENVVSNYTYQDFVNFLNNKYIQFYLQEDAFEYIQENFLYIRLSESENQNQLFINGKNILKLLVATWVEKNKNSTKHYEYCLPVYDMNTNWIIESSNLKEGQPQSNAYDLILAKMCPDPENLEKNLETWRGIKVFSLELIKPNKLLKKGFNIVSGNLNINNLKFQVDFHVNLIRS